MKNGFLGQVRWDGGCHVDSKNGLQGPRFKGSILFNNTAFGSRGRDISTWT